MRLKALAPAKVNLCMFLGPLRSDGRHEVVTLLESVSLADEVTVAAAPADRVVCAGIHEPNIVTRTLDGLRERGWEGPAMLLTIDKRIPVAAGMGGGSADAAAALRIAHALAPMDAYATAQLAASLGADVPSQLRPGLSLGTGAGEIVEAAYPLAPHAFVVVPQDFGLSTADVYREADRLGLPRAANELSARHAQLRRALQAGARLPAELLVNDLQAAALSLRPELGRVLDAVRAAGADHATVTGSGPTVVGLCWGEEAEEVAADAARALADRYPRAVCAGPVSEEFGDPRGT